MFVIRPIVSEDLEGLIKLLQHSGPGLTSLPMDKKILAQRIELSERSFSYRRDRPRGEHYLFVMEEFFTGKIVGVAGIISKIGGFEPYYFYRTESELKKSSMAKVSNEVKTLHFHFVHNGPAEICSLYLHPKYRNSENGKFLSLSRFLYIANNRSYFEDKIIAEMRGVVNRQGHSPFWDAVGKHFFQMDFPKADLLTMQSKMFIDELSPKYPLIVNLLPKQAQEVIGKVHPNTEPAKRILEKEGFTTSGYVGIFEPGPVLEAETNKVRTIKESQVVRIKKIIDQEAKGNPYIISTTSEDFRSTIGPVTKHKDGSVSINAVTAAILKLKQGDELRYSSFKGNRSLVKKFTKKTPKKKRV